VWFRWRRPLSAFTWLLADECGEGRNVTVSSLDKTIDIQQFLRVLWRRKGIVFLCTISAFCAALIGLSFVPEQYDSKVVIVIGDRKPLIGELEAVMGGSQRRNARASSQDRMSKLVSRIRSQPFLERVVRLLKMDQDPVIREQARLSLAKHAELTEDEMTVRILVKNLQSRIRFAAEGPEVYRVTVSDFSAENAQTLAKWISELFVDVTVQNAVEYMETLHEFGSGQLRVYEEQLRLSEDALERYREFRIEQSLAQTLVNSANIVMAEAMYVRVADGATSARVRINPLADGLHDSGLDKEQFALLADSEIRALSADLTAALRDEITDRLTASAQGGWPPQGTYGVLRRGLFGEIERKVSGYYPEADRTTINAVTRFVFSKVDLEAHSEAAGFLTRSIRAFKRQAQSQPGGEIEIARLVTEVETNRQLLHSFQAQLVATDVNQAVEMTDLGLQIEILDPAQLPLFPSRPNRRKILVASLLLGPLLGAGFAFLSETIDPTLRSLHDFGKIVPEPVLGTTPLMDRLVSRRPWIRRYWIPATATGMVILTAAFFGLQANVMHQLAAKGHPVEMVSPEEAIDANP